MINKFIIVFLGGGVGACLRFSLSLLVKSFTLKMWVATLSANLIGCLVFFLIAKIDFKSVGLEEFLKIGLLGSLTTFSTFSFEVVSLLKEGRYFESGLVFFLNIFFGIIIGIGVFR